MTGANSGTPVEGLSPKGIRPAQRIWLEDQGLPVFGAGIRELLVRVEATGSLRHAASDMGMAYSKAWHIVRRAEEHLGFDLLERRIGGAHGGGSGVSDEGRWLVRAFGAVLDEADEMLGELYEKHFGDWEGGSGDIRMDRAPQSMSSPGQD